jgi:hypothetical protein
MSWGWVPPLTMVVVGGGVAATVAGEVRRAKARVRLARVEVPQTGGRPRRAGTSAGRATRPPGR